MTPVIIITCDDRRVVVEVRPDGLYRYFEQVYHPDEQQDVFVIAGGWQTYTASGLFSSAEPAEHHARQSISWMR